MEACFGDTVWPCWTWWAQTTLGGWPLLLLLCIGLCFAWHWCFEARWSCSLLLLAVGLCQPEQTDLRGLRESRNLHLLKCRSYFKHISKVWHGEDPAASEAYLANLIQKPDHILQSTSFTLLQAWPGTGMLHAVPAIGKESPLRKTTVFHCMSWKTKPLNSSASLFTPPSLLLEDLQVPLGTNPVPSHSLSTLK